MTRKSESIQKSENEIPSYEISTTENSWMSSTSIMKSSVTEICSRNKALSSGI